jgi:hypothetical protein
MSSKVKHSAYRSMQLGAEGKTLSTPAKKADLIRWTREQWKNLTPSILGDTKFYACGTKSQEQIKKGLPSVCRPTIKVSKETPTLAENYSKQQIKKAVSIKSKGGRINWDKL